MLARSAREKRLEARGACVVLAVSRKFMTRLLCAKCKDVHVQCHVLCVRVAASNSHGTCSVWMRIALWGRIRVRRSECASRGGVHCRGAGGDGAHAILSGEEVFPHVFVNYDE